MLLKFYIANNYLHVIFLPKNVHCCPCKHNTYELFQICLNCFGIFTFDEILHSYLCCLLNATINKIIDFPPKTNSNELLRLPPTTSKSLPEF